MVRPYTGPYITVRHLLNSTDKTPQDSGQNLPIHLVQTIHDENDERFADSRDREYKGIVSKGKVRVFFCSELPPNVNFAGNTFFLSNNYPARNEQRFKTRWVLHGYHYKDHIKLQMAGRY